MFLNVIYMFVLMLGSFILSRSVLHLFKSNNLDQNYHIWKDPWLYLFLLIMLGITAIYFLIPNNFDFVSEFKYTTLATYFALSALIYIIFLFETELLTFVGVALSAAVIAWIAPSDFLLLESAVPFWADRLIIATILILMTYGCRLLNGMDGVLALQLSAIALGMSIFALLGGLPLMLGFISAYLLGIWLGYLHLDWYPSSLHLHDGAALSGGFLVGCLMLTGANELAGPSLFLLNMYIWVEIVWTLVRRYIYQKRSPDWFEDTAYWSIFETGINIPSIDWGIFKILTLNTLMAVFQLYSPMPYSFIVFVTLFNLWYLNIMYTAQSGKVTFKDANKEFIENIKKGFEEIKETIDKDKGEL